MRLIHTGDLHIGKSVNNFSMIEDQKAILDEIAQITKDKKADAIIIAGDIYDRSVPTAEAVIVLNDFLEKLKKLRIPMMIISGNHDSPERIGFAEKFLEEQSVFIAGRYENQLKEVTLQDDYGDVVFTLMPFVKPALLSATTCEEAVAGMLKTIEEQSHNQNTRKVLVAHYFVTRNGLLPELSDSEIAPSVGGLDSVDSRLFREFDYVALGHIHKPQRMDGDSKCMVNYAGAPLAYSFSECGMEKSVTLVDMKEKGNVSMERILLHPLHEMRKIKGKLEELIKPEILKLTKTEDYIQVTLTNEEELIDPVATLRGVYPNIMQLIFEKDERKTGSDFEEKLDTKEKTPRELFCDFYLGIREKELDEERLNVIDEICREMKNSET